MITVLYSVTHQILNKHGVLFIYNHHATIFQFFDAVVSTTPSCEFFPGETRLQAINNELERLELSSKSYYNADGIIFDNDTGLELCLLETSNAFGLIDASRKNYGSTESCIWLIIKCYFADTTLITNDKNIPNQFSHAVFSQQM